MNSSSPSQMKFVRKGIDLGAMFNDDRFSSDPVDITLEFMPGDGERILYLYNSSRYT